MLKNDFIFWKAFGKIENKEILTNFIQDLTGEKVENLVYHEQNLHQMLINRIKLLKR